ncbi:MAG: TRAP transporter large permease [Rhodobacteraceae bacterium]|jgi:tripartite ATP-independent transporter DctM subunit|nr:TRAP transporter large permease [Paracoccaceae bacterium]
MADPVALGFAALAVLLLLIVLRMPVAHAMILAGGGGMVLAVPDGTRVLLAQLKTLAYGVFSNYDLSVIPMFVLMGALATRAGFSQALFRAANAWFGWLRGGTAMAAIAACAGFGAVSGSSLATASTMGRVALPELLRYRYSGALATGTLAAGGVLGILIPPSVVLVIYAIIVEANIVTMFMAALVPGLIAVVLFMGTIAAYVAVRPQAGPAGGAGGRAEFRAATLGALPVLAVFAAVIGGIYAGLYGPTPAAAIGVFLVWLFGLMRAPMTLRDWRAVLIETAATSGMIYLILLGAEMLKIYLGRVRLPQVAAEFVVGAGLEPFTVLLLLLAALVLLGCLMDSLSMILLVIPFFWPVLVALNGGPVQQAEGSGFGMSTDDLKIWFGILALIVVELGLITPPVGMNVFVISAIARDVPMIETFRGLVPFLLAEVGRVALILAFPAVALWLPRLLAG